MQKGARKKSKHFDFKAIYIIPTIRSVKESHLVGGSNTNRSRTLPPIGELHSAPKLQEKYSTVFAALSSFSRKFLRFLFNRRKIKNTDDCLI